MTPKDLLTSIARRQQLTGDPLLRAFAVQPKITAVRRPAGVDDSDDPRGLLLTLTDEERTSLGFPLRATDEPPPAKPILLRWAGAPDLVRVHVHAILCANDDGSGGAADANAIDAEYLESVVFHLNWIYRETGLQFVFDPAVDFEVVHDSLLNLDFTMPAGLNLNAPAEPPLISDQEMAALKRAHDAARQDIGRRYEHKMVWLFCDGNILKHDGTTWVSTARDFAFSGSDLEYVALPTGKGGVKDFAYLLAHETGHYFHLSHTHGPLVQLPPADMASLTAKWDTRSQADRDAANAEILRRLIDTARSAMLPAAAALHALGRNVQEAANVFDGDGVADTPPDPGPTLLSYVNGGPDNAGCGAIGRVEIPMFAGQQGVVLEPDRANALSYFKHCTNFAMHFSHEQIFGANGMRASIDRKNRQHLVTPFAVAIYEHADFQGRRQYLAPGRYDVSSVKIGNDTLSSVRVPEGWTVTLFSEAGFWGDSALLGGDTRQVPPHLNDRTSSIVVERAPVTIYQHAGFRGARQTLTAGRWDLAQLAMGNDTLSSVQVPPGWRVTLFSEAGFRGDTLVLNGDTPHVGGRLNDRTSSLVVESPLVAIFEETDFQGCGQTLAAGRYDVAQLRLGNDVAQSIRVPAGWKATLFSEAGFSGDSATVTADERSLDTLANRTSSIVVEPLRLPPN